MQIQGHDALFRISETLVRLGTENDLVLAKQLFEFASVGLPPFTIERINHDLDNNDVIALHGAPTFPQPLGRGTSVGGEATEHVRQLRSDRVVSVRLKRVTRVVVNREKDLREVWHSSGAN
jgi:hypothetical protein